MTTAALTLAEFIKQVAEKADLPAASVQAVLRAELDVARENLAEGTAVPAVNGGVKLSVGQRAARAGRNPRTGEPLTIAAKKVVTAKASSKLASAVEGQ